MARVRAAAGLPPFPPHRRARAGWGETDGDRSGGGGVGGGGDDVGADGGGGGGAGGSAGFLFASLNQLYKLDPPALRLFAAVLFAAARRRRAPQPAAGGAAGLWLVLFEAEAEAGLRAGLGAAGGPGGPLVLTPPAPREQHMIIKAAADLVRLGWVGGMIFCGWDDIVCGEVEVGDCKEERRGGG